MTIWRTRVLVRLEQVCESLYCSGCWEGHCVTLAMACEPVQGTGCAKCGVKGE